MSERPARAMLVVVVAVVGERTLRLSRKKRNIRTEKGMRNRKEQENGKHTLIDTLCIKHMP